ncbi:ankyrin repeat-containing domain protein, partial [Mycena epipterygia]
GSPLHAAASNGHTDIVGILLGKGADANAHGTYGWQGHCGSAVKAACDAGYAETNTYIVGLLLEKGADINSQSEEYGSALEVACCRGHINIVPLLLENGADVDEHKDCPSPA